MTVGAAVPFELYVSYIAACLAMLVTPGPMVSLIVANSLKHGTRAGILNLLGSQTGQAVMLAILLLGLKPVMVLVGDWFDWIRIIGAVYLVYLGLKMLLAPESRAFGGSTTQPRRGGFFWQGLGVSLANPKLLLFFGAFIPQFIDTARPVEGQVLVLVVTFMALAMLIDGGYAVLAGQAGTWLTGRRRLWMSRISGGILIAGGIWLALLRR